MSDFSDDLSSFSLMDLFRAEVESNAATLEQGLLEVESAPDNLAAIEPLMRAAHSIKGAARIVGLDPAVQLAHVMEDLLVAAQRGQVRLGPGSVDALLTGADLLRRLGKVAEGESDAFFAERAEAFASAISRLVAAQRGEGAPAAKATVSPPASPPSAVPSHEGASARPDPPPALSPAAPVAPEPETPAAESAAARSRREASRVGVRIDPESLTRVLAYAGESVVQARRMGRQTDRLAVLKARLDRTANILERVQPLPGKAAESLAAAKIELAGVRALVLERMEAMDQATRRGTDLAERLYEQVLRSRLRPFAEGVVAFPRSVRDLGRELGKQVKFEIDGQDVPVDRDILDALEAPLNHMLRNALDHGLETAQERETHGKPAVGTLQLRARHHAGMLEIRVQDDGRGVDLEALRARIIERKLITPEIARDLSESELLEFLFLPGFSTAKKVTEISGRGVGLDVVHSMVRDAGGTVRAERCEPAGLRFVLVLPITRSVIRVALVEVAGQPVGFPLTQIERLVRVAADQIQQVENRQHFERDGKIIGLIPAADLLGLKATAPSGDSICVVVLRSGADLYGLAVNRYIGEQRLVVRPLDPRLGRVANVSSLALDGGGDAVVILDVPDLIRSIDLLLHEGRLRSIRALVREAPTARKRKRVLVVDDSITVREVERKLLSNRGYHVDVCVDGADAWNSVRTHPYDLVLTDVDMPRMDGIELVRRIRADDRLRRLPVMIVSYKDREEDRLRGLEAGANVYLTKSSFHDETLVREVFQLIGEAEAQ